MNRTCRILMVTCASVARPTGYAMRTRLALAAHGEVLNVAAAAGSPYSAGKAPPPAPSEQKHSNALPTSIRLVCFESLRDMIRPRLKQRIAEILDFPAESMSVLPLWPKKPPAAWRCNALWITAALRRLLARYRPAIVHAQSHLAAGLCARALANNPETTLVFDAHGVDLEEALSDGRLRADSAEYAFRLALQRDALLRADWILAVSQALADHLLASADPQARVRIVPCVSCDVPFSRGEPAPDAAGLFEGRGTDRSPRRFAELGAATRRLLGLGQQPVVVYLGSAAPWQQPEMIVDGFRALRHLIPKAVLLVISHDDEVFRRLLAAADLPPTAYRCLSLPHHDTFTAVAAGDAGLLLRANSLVNRVASPTKFAEYLRAGVPVVVSDTLADFAVMPRRHQLGAVVPGDAPAEVVAAATARLLELAPEEREHVRLRCRRAAESQLAFGAVLHTYREIAGTRIPHSEAYADGKRDHTVVPPLAVDKGESRSYDVTETIHG